MIVGIVGGGQLARMLALAGYPLGLRFSVYDPNPDASAGQLAPLTVGQFDDIDRLVRFASEVDVLTFDFENVPANSLRALSGRVRIAPGPELLEVAQDRVLEKQAAQTLGIPCGAWWPIEDGRSLVSLLERRPGEYVLKARRFGYDGKGQVRIADDESRSKAIALADAQPCILEALVPFRRELSIIATRSSDGSMIFYPLSENHHQGGVLQTTIAPAPQFELLQPAAEEHIRMIAERFAYVGTLALELFEVGGNLWFNEMAPRVHNSGHWSIEGTTCSQFENHLRAICGLPLGYVRTIARSVMTNFLGAMPPLSSLLSQDHVHVHDYGKLPRHGRKVGHMTRLVEFM